jgi:hypothetical protein
MSLRIPIVAILLLTANAAFAQATRPMSVEEKLLMRVSVDMDGLTLAQVFEKIGEQTRLSIIANLRVIEASGFAVTTYRLRGQVKDVTARGAIELAIREVGFERPPGLVIDGEVLRLSWEIPTLTRSYPIGRVIRAQNKLRGPTTLPAERQFDEAADDLVKTVQKAIDPDSWRDAGGTLGAASIFREQLIVTQTRDNHKRIEALLRQLEKTDAQ